jgi:hypothetical protein
MARQSDALPRSRKPIADRRAKTEDRPSQDAAALAHKALDNLSVDLPRPIERQLGDEVDAARMRVGRRVGETELLELVFADLRPLRLADQDHRHFPLDAVRYRHDRDLGDARMLQQHVLDLERIDVLAAGVEHVVGAALEIEEPLGIPFEDVAGLQPAVADALPFTSGRR